MRVAIHPTSIIHSSIPLAASAWSASYCPTFFSSFLFSDLPESSLPRVGKITGNANIFPALPVYLAQLGGGMVSISPNVFPLGLGHHRLDQRTGIAEVFVPTDLPPNVVYVKHF
jgi:hypothetical protein